MKKYALQLRSEEREQLEALIRNRKSPEKRLPKTRTLLKADARAERRG